MNFLFVCKASEKTGLGHLIRSRSLARYFVEQPGVNVDFVVLEQNFEKLMSTEKINYFYYQKESEVHLSSKYDYIFLDMLTIDDEFFDKLKKHSKIALLSPIFSRGADVDLFFHRTQYQSCKELDAVKGYKGLSYSIISDECKKIPNTRFSENLKSEDMSIAISMGGGDAKNKTLNLLKTIKGCKVSATFWVILGEGYSHSYDDLVKEVKSDSQHEIILVRSNRNMWHILQNCVLGIFPGGITAYEAAFAGLPSLIMVETEDQRYLIQELEEKKFCKTVSLSSANYKKELISTIEDVFENRNILHEMHEASEVMDNKGAQRIFEIVQESVRDAR